MTAVTEEMKQFAVAIATANGHPAPHQWADAVAKAYEAEPVAPVVAQEPAASEAAAPEADASAQ